ncbi:hypothetical protein QQG09_09400 [Melissococcus plutonius]|nr:hypothetical protein [Melissococcus plutonius]
MTWEKNGNNRPCQRVKLVVSDSVKTIIQSDENSAHYKEMFI